MFGTGREILRAASHYGRFMNQLDLSAQGGIRIRKHLDNGMSEEQLEDYLVRIGARKIRDKVVVPAAIKDKKGRLFTEATFLLSVENEKMFDDLNLNLVCGHIRIGELPNERIVREVMRRKKAYIFAQRVVLPAIWELVVDDKDRY